MFCSHTRTHVLTLSVSYTPHTCILRYICMHIIRNISQNTDESISVTLSV